MSLKAWHAPKHFFAKMLPDMIWFAPKRPTRVNMGASRLCVLKIWRYEESNSQFCNFTSLDFTIPDFTIPAWELGFVTPNVYVKLCDLEMQHIVM